ncbi:MAG: transpeptidase family protein [Lentimicrobiaceae bacterium]|nr:transpeptidase family protein [Lentimicrobiaceae bacterium]MCO5266459.1 transpeptidase family protein [Lentimicrobium sp.]HPG33554.1 penicillin-binding protein [Lentimicrobium sp.]
MDENRRDILKKVYLVYIFMVVLALAIIGKALYIQVVEGNEWREKAKKLSIRYDNIEAIRGNILASDESLLAASVPVFDLRVDAGNTHYKDDFFYENVDSLALCLSNLFGDKSKKEYKDLLIKGRKNNNRFLLLKRNITYAHLKKVRKFPIFRLGKYKGGIIAEARNKRELPFKWLAFRTIGWDKDGKENDIGLEGAYSQILEGESGQRLMQRIGNGVWRPLNDENEIEPRNGHDILTSIDINIQDVAEDALMRQLIANDADHGCAVLMEVNTGFIVAIANLGKNGDGVYEEKYNYAIGESSEPGSTFKLASVIAALDDGLIKLSDSVDTQGGAVRFANRIMKDSHEGGYGVISIRRAFELSSNVGISKIIHRAYHEKPQQFIEKLYSMHLNKKLGLDIPGEGNPSIKDTKSKIWSKVSLPWMSIGYEVAMTPLQTLAFYNAVANNGVMVKPQFIREIRMAGETVQSFEPVILCESIVKNKETITQVKSLLEGVVERGTATNLKNPVFKIAGKTGTAQIAQNNSGYNKSNYKASFVGYFPADNPKYSMIVVINNPSKGVYYGGSIAGPVFRDVANKVYATRLDPSIKKTDSIPVQIPVYAAGNAHEIELILKEFNVQWTGDAQQYDYAAMTGTDSTIKISPRPVMDAKTPDVTGMGARDATYLLESAGLKVQIRGKGQVKRQSVPAGTKARKGSNCIIELG